MPDAIYGPGPLIVYPTPGAVPGQIVGVGNQWSDDSDATYAVLSFDNTNGGDYVGGFIEGVASPPAIQSAELRVRLSFNIGNTGLDRSVFVHYFIDEIDIGATEVTAASLGVTEDVTVSVPPEHLNAPYTFADFRAALIAGTATARVLMGSPAGFGTVNEGVVFELEFHTYGASVTPARRLYPRTDAHGLGIGRGYPPPSTPQASGRTGSSSAV